MKIGHLSILEEKETKLPIGLLGMLFYIPFHLLMWGISPLYFLLDLSFGNEGFIPFKKKKKKS